MSKRYICEGCNESSRSGVTIKCRETCTDCMFIPLCVCTDVRIPFEACNRTFRSQACFNKHKTNKLKGKTVFAQKRNCAKCDGLLVHMHKHECFKSFCGKCQKNRELGHLCYMAPLANKLPKSDNVLFVFHGFETRQDTRISDSATLQSPTSYTCNSSAHNARCRPMYTRIASAVAGEDTRSGKTPWATWYLICANRDRGAKE